MAPTSASCRICSSIEGGRIGLSPSYRGGPTELTTAITGDVPVAYQVDTGTVFTILTDNSYTGGTTLAGGVVATNSNGAFSTGDIVVINPTAEIRTTSDTDLTIANSVSLAQTLTLSTADAQSSLTMSGIITGTGGIEHRPDRARSCSPATAYRPDLASAQRRGDRLAPRLRHLLLETARHRCWRDLRRKTRLRLRVHLRSRHARPAVQLRFPRANPRRRRRRLQLPGVIDSGIGAVTFDTAPPSSPANAYWRHHARRQADPPIVSTGNDQALSAGPITVIDHIPGYTVGDNPITLANDIG